MSVCYLASHFNDGVDGWSHHWVFAQTFKASVDNDTNNHKESRWSDGGAKDIECDAVKAIMEK